MDALKKSVAAETQEQKGKLMEVHRDFELCEPSPFLYFDNGQLALTDGRAVWMVIVSRQAMMATANPQEASLRRLVRYSHFYRDLASAAIRRGDDVHGKVWVLEADVLAARSNLPTRGPLGDLPAQVGR